MDAATEPAQARQGRQVVVTGLGATTPIGG
ncbi:MAG: hypothetical protein QOH29_1342, partial [Actinomycetota bacterium]|nr:hypothetical protein [Actinomycetota bacterium]